MPTPDSHNRWEESPALDCPCCTPTAYGAPLTETPSTPVQAYETPTIDHVQFSTWARAIALETAAETGAATLGEHIDMLILRLRAITDGEEPLALHHLPDNL